MSPEEQLQVEQRAVEIAYAIFRGDDIERTDHEMAGWMRYADNREPRIKKTHRQELEWQAGWLSAHIWSEIMRF